MFQQRISVRTVWWNDIYIPDEGESDINKKAHVQ